MAYHTPVKIKRTIYTIFTKKYGLHLQTDTSRYLEGLLAQVENPVDELEVIIKNYKKRYNGKNYQRFRSIQAS